MKESFDRKNYSIYSLEEITYLCLIAYNSILRWLQSPKVGSTISCIHIQTYKSACKSKIVSSLWSCETSLVPGVQQFPQAHSRLFK